MTSSKSEIESQFADTPFLKWTLLHAQESGQLNSPGLSEEIAQSCSADAWLAQWRAVRREKLKQESPFNP